MRLAAILSPAPAHRIALLLFVLFGFAFALFTQDEVSHNTLCRAAMAANLVQDGRVEIDGFEPFTNDIAFRDGHYYCDKAPGMSFLAAPMAALFTRIAPITPETPYNQIWVAFLYLSALTTSGLLCAIAGVLLFKHVLARTNAIGAALIGAITFALGTPVWGWATSFFSHAATAALLVLGYIALDESIRRAKVGAPQAAFALLAGLAFGGATAVEYTALIPALIIGGCLAALIARQAPRALLRVFAIAAVGALAALAPVLWFHAAAFGAPFTTGYAFTVTFEAHHSGLFGINAPSPDVIVKLLVSLERGLIWYAPIVLAMGWAVVKLARDGGANRALGFAAGLVMLWYLLMNAGFGYWEGGASTGPRYLTPAIGFGALALGLAWPLFGRWERRVALALLALSILINFAATGVGMTAGGAAIPGAFFSGELRQALSYRIFEAPSILHFIPPLCIAAILGRLIWRQVNRLKAGAVLAYD